jgi:hypothetical protein
MEYSMEYFMVQKWSAGFYYIHLHIFFTVDSMLLACRIQQHLPKPTFVGENYNKFRLFFVKMDRGCEKT